MEAIDGIAHSTGRWASNTDQMVWSLGP
jgi:hypothetical protein